jgi:hypothetical protein
MCWYKGGGCFLSSFIVLVVIEHDLSINDALLLCKQYLVVVAKLVFAKDAATGWGATYVKY